MSYNQPSSTQTDVSSVLVDQKLPSRPEIGRALLSFLMMKAFSLTCEKCCVFHVHTIGTFDRKFPWDLSKMLCFRVVKTTKMH